ncbi:MAG TPA: alpha/beta fold hydrolase [Gemmatimonadaceae bacterium]|nr:alpha/beta fold hydrolase [Gemmatimonadaceae bacterium]
MPLKRQLLALAMLASVAPTLRAQPPQAPAARQTFVIVHGAWGGGWDWKAVDSALTSRGHRVHRVTLTGLGERVHLANANVGLQTHIDDVVNTIRFEQLRDVTLVGHSYGGMVVTGAADQATDRIRRVVYVDAFLPDSGESLASLAGAGFNQMVASSARNGLIVPAWVKAEDPAPKDVPHPVKTMTDTLRLTNPTSRKLAGHYILTMAPNATKDDFSSSADRAIRRAFTMDTLRTDHTPERSAIPALVQLLSERR